MKHLRNTGTERVVDLVRPWLRKGAQVDLVTPTFSLFAFGELLDDLGQLAKARLVLPPPGEDLALLGSPADYDLGTEAAFADQLEKNSAIKVYAKLPGWFHVPTPLGSYNPDWAILIDTEEGERLYFVVETKSELFLEGLRDQERLKIECGKMHFGALHVREASARYVVARTVDDVLNSAHPR